MRLHVQAVDYDLVLQKYCPAGRERLMSQGVMVILAQVVSTRHRTIAIAMFWQNNSRKFIIC